MVEKDLDIYEWRCEWLMNDCLLKVRNVISLAFAGLNCSTLDESSYGSYFCRLIVALEEWLTCKW